MDLSFFPNEYIKGLSKVNFNNLYEIRLRVGFAVLLKFSDKTLYLGKDGQTLLEENAIICSKLDVDTVIKNVTECSLYAFNERIKSGYLTTGQGVRIGLAGECVFENEKILTIKNFTSLNVRIPHEIIDCSQKIFEKIFVPKNNFLYNSLIVSPPTFGKTTILKDLARKIDKLNCGDILIIDERGEFSNVKGQNIDIVQYSNKLYAFEYSLRSMAPKIVITDELSTKNDWVCVSDASNCGVCVLASCHARDISDLKRKKYFKKGVFDRIILLKSTGQAGVIDSIYNNEFNRL